MKNALFSFIIFIMYITFITVISGSVSALSPTPSDISPTKKTTSTPAPTQNDQIEKIKDLVASRVAELKLVDKRGIVGHVKNSTNSQIILSGSDDKQIMVDIDELTKFVSKSRESFGISDIKNGDFLSIIGLYNKQTEKLLARFTQVASNIPQNIEGVVTLKDISEFTLAITTGEGDKNTINIETSTKTSSYNNGQTTKSGFSKITAGQRIIVVGFADKNDDKTINASRVIHFPNLELSPELKKAYE